MAHSAPSQPPLNTAYNHPSNPASQTPLEAEFSTSTSASLQRSGSTEETRKPNDLPLSRSDGEIDATPSSLGYGVRDDSGDRGDELGGPASNLDGEQMRAAGEGEIYKAQQEKTGFGEQGDLAAGLDRKREEQDRIKEERGEKGGEGEVDVEAAVGGRGKGFVGVNSGSGGSGVGD
ncbi:hypothetical protein MMC07_002519 [Pseudocyphellaria aurata]|nr:hypothetical protein [Pseudocyphellaria aurata]